MASPVVILEQEAVCSLTAANSWKEGGREGSLLKVRKQASTLPLVWVRYGRVTEWKEKGAVIAAPLFLVGATGLEPVTPAV